MGSVMKSSCRKYLAKAALVWAGGFVVLLLGYVFVLGPQRNTRALVEHQLAEKKQAYESALIAAQDKTVRELNTQVEALRNRLSDYVIDFENAANLTFDISEIAGENKLGLFRQKVEGGGPNMARSESEYLLENAISVSFTGDFNQFAAFLNAMERHRPVVFVDEFTISRSVKSDSGHPAKMTLTVLVRKERES